MGFLLLTIPSALQGTRARTRGHCYSRVPGMRGSNHERDVYNGRLAYQVCGDPNMSVTFTTAVADSASSSLRTHELLQTPPWKIKEKSTKARATTGVVRSGHNLELYIGTFWRK